jgi:DGQHR domain-containing protein
MNFEYPALFSRQRDAAPKSVLFSAPVGELLTWATIDRLAHEGTGHQRAKNEAKVRAIGRFLELDNRNSIPTALTIALELPDFAEPEGDGPGTLTIPRDGERHAVVIDGQHRLYGMADFDATMRVNVVGLLNPADEEVAFQFLVINNKVTRVATDHLKLLALTYNEEALAERLSTARMVLSKHASLVGIVDGSNDSPFFQQVDWPIDKGDRPAALVLPAAVEGALAIIAQKNLPDLEDDDALLDFFFTLWREVKGVWTNLWTPDSQLLSKVGVVCLTTFIIEDLTPLADRGDLDLSNPDDVKVEIQAVLGSLAPQFWTSEWTAKSLDTQAGRQMVVEALRQVRRNVRREAPWYTDVPLVGHPDGT